MHGEDKRTLQQEQQAGTSLIELMCAMAAGLFVLGATFYALSYFQHLLSGQQREMAQQQDLRLGLEVLEQELRLAEPGSLSMAAADSVEFSANLQGRITKVTAETGVGQTILPVEDGRGWDERKTIVVCWAERCETMILARAGQRQQLTVSQPVTGVIPAGAMISLQNRIRYYSRRNDQGVLRFLRQVDGGSSVLVGDIRDARFIYHDENGQAATQPEMVRMIVVEVRMAEQEIPSLRAISLRT